MSRPSVFFDNVDELRNEYDWMYEFMSRMAEQIRGDPDVHSLHDYVAKIEDENASLKGAAQGLGELCDEYKAENAKLRELVWDLYCLAYPSTVEWEVSDATYDKYSPCEKCHELHGGKSPCAGTAKDMTEECCAPIQANVVADRMRELGIEVE